MNSLTLLRDIRLVPVLELEPWRFSTGERPRPSGSVLETPEGWGRYWHDCLADAGIIGPSPLYPGSWHVLVRELEDGEALQKILRTLVGDSIDLEAPIDADGTPALEGGLALFSERKLLVAPTCCSDLGNLSEWRDAAGYRESEWRILWIGHPWLSVRYEGNLLVISEPHESDTASGRWAVDAGVLDRAVDAAEVELERFSRRLERVLMILGSGDQSSRLARRLAGLAD
jgi:hypothetical protein